MNSPCPLTPKHAFVGDRLLISDMYGPEYVMEVQVLEWSPSGNRVKLHYSTQEKGQHSWMNEDTVRRTHIVEILPKVKTP